MPRALALTALASRERVAPIVFRPPAGATRVDVTSAFGAEGGWKRIGDRTGRAASTLVSADDRLTGHRSVDPVDSHDGPAKAGHYFGSVRGLPSIRVHAILCTQSLTAVWPSPRIRRLPRQIS